MKNYSPRDHAPVRPLSLRWSQPAVGKSELSQTLLTMNKMGAALTDRYNPHATY